MTQATGKQGMVVREDEAVAITILCATYYVSRFTRVFRDFLNFSIEVKIIHGLQVHSKC